MSDLVINEDEEGEVGEKKKMKKLVYYERSWPSAFFCYFLSQTRTIE